MIIVIALRNWLKLKLNAKKDSTYLKVKAKYVVTEKRNDIDLRWIAVYSIVSKIISILLS